MNIKRCYLKVNIKLMAKIHSKKDLYDVVPKHKKWYIAINDKGNAYVHYQRHF